MPLAIPRQPHGDDGFSLVEAIVALAIATAIFTALAFALIGGAKAGLLSQQNQQAGDVLNQSVEHARALSYNELAMTPGDLDTGEPTRSPTLSGCSCYNPSSDSTTEDAAAGTQLEALAPTDINGRISPHVTQTVQNGRTFTVRSYVTVPADASGAVYKRLTVVVTWDGLGKERKRIYSTLVADTERGLPLPDFKYNAVGGLSQCRNPGSSLTYGFTLRNNGARDAWSLTPTTGTPAWSYYEDTDSDGAFDPALDAALPATAGVVTTGLIEPTAVKDFFAVTTLQTALERPAPYTLTTVFRATSVAQPTYWQELTAVTTVQDAACGAVTSPTPSASPTPEPTTAPTQPAASCTSLTGSVATEAPEGTMVRYYPVNPDQPGNTVASTSMPVQRDAGAPPSQQLLYNYSTELHGLAGRELQPGSTSSTSAAQLASWNYTMPSTSKIKGKGEVTLYAMPADADPNARPTFTVVIETLKVNGTVDTVLGTATYTTPESGWGCETFRPISLSIVDTGSTAIEVKQNRQIRLRVVNTGSADVILAYGTQGHPMTMTLPYVEGLG
jgi:type II secretory pathway pseudopilin PulG